MTSDSEFIAANAHEAATAHRAMANGGYYDGSVVAEFERFFPVVATAYAEFVAHYERDAEAWRMAHSRPFDAYDWTSIPPAFGPEQFSERTKHAKTQLDTAVEAAYSTIREA